MSLTQDNIVAGQQRSASESTIATLATVAGLTSSNQSQACYDAKLKDFRNGMGKEASVSDDTMNEWRSKCWAITGLSQSSGWTGASMPSPRKGGIFPHRTDCVFGQPRLDIQPAASKVWFNSSCRSNMVAE